MLDYQFPLSISRARHISTVVVDDRGHILRGFSVKPGFWRLPVKPKDVDPRYLQMLLAYEDQRFMIHPGIDPLAAIRALKQWLWHGKVISGASTLTMQTARLLEPHQRDLPGKLVEMLRALQLEWRYSKDTILEFYLTLAPYGGNLEGVRAASLAWFGKEPTRLTAAEAALLVVLPQAPSRLRPDRFPARARAARDKVLSRMVQLKVLSTHQAREARQEPVPAQRRALPFLAPHLAGRLHANQPKTAQHHSFIKRNLQQTLETLVRQQQSVLESHSSIALLVVANASQQVWAYIGSSDFFSLPRNGYVDMVRAIRSPGSTLKPLVYGLGFDDLLIHPETLIDDKPAHFGDYSPTNFRNTYAGQLTVREALQQSRNIPAVAVLEQVGPTRVAARLRQAGLSLHWNQTKPQPGLPLVLGGVGTTLEDLVTLYTGIANGGKVAPLRFSTTDRPSSGQRVLSHVACWYLADILRGAPVSQRIAPSNKVATSRLIAHKTGTSYGFRDAWALGFDTDYTVGVWVGRPDGSPNPGYYGYNTAAPLLFRIFDVLPATVNPPRPPPPGVLQITNRSQLPERLRYFHIRPATDTPRATPLDIVFPVAGTKVELSDNNGVLEVLPLVANGGIRPLRWLVNGIPLTISHPWRRHTFWQPDGQGLARITVLDHAGQITSIDVWISRKNQ